MTLSKRLFTTFGPDLFPTFGWSHFGIGFDRVFDELANIEDRLSDQANYPPHNIKKIGEHLYELELAVAGFTEQDINVEVEKHLLTVRGTKNVSASQDEYLYRGLGQRSFTKTLALAETVEVRSAILEHGMLRIRLENVIPEKDQKRSITITSVRS